MSAPSMGSYSEQSHESLIWVAQDRLHLKAVPYYVHASDDHFPSRLPHLPSTSLPYWHEAIPTTYSAQVRSITGALSLWELFNTTHMIMRYAPSRIFTAASTTIRPLLSLVLLCRAAVPLRRDDAFSDECLITIFQISYISSEMLLPSPNSLYPNLDDVP